MKMPKFKAVLWEQVSVWQTVTVVAEANSEDDLRNGNYQIEDYLNQDTEWSTEQHLCFDAKDIEILEEIKNA
jgi:hypothetical protein